MGKKLLFVLGTPLFLICLFLIERFAFITVDTNYDPYSERADEKRALRGQLIDSGFVIRISSDDINSLFPEHDEIPGDIDHLPTFDIDLYRIRYTSVFLDDIVTLSGLVIVPDREGSLSHMQYHHGTMLPFPFPNGEGALDAPSLYAGNYPETDGAHYETRLFGNYLGSAGFLVSLPDYIGYGASEDYEHPYSVNDRLAEQSVDMILATKSFARQNNIELDGTLYLSGWSEGGAASVATQKLIEERYTDLENNEESLSVTANFSLAGFYNTELYSKLFVSLFPLDSSDWGGDLDVLIWTLYAINAYSDDRPVDTAELFKIPVENQLDILKNRTTSIPSKITPYVFQGKDDLISKFAKNDLSDGWAPKAPLYIHHGTRDDIVYYPLNAELTVENLRNNGGNATLVRYDDHDHYSPAKLYLLDMLDLIDQG